MEWLPRLVAVAAAILEVAGIGAILLGALTATVRVAVARTLEGESRYRLFRIDLGKAILLGLELLVGADIIRSVAAPSFANVSVLGLIVAVRTFLSITLTVELEGRWPWQRGPGPLGP